MLCLGAFGGFGHWLLILAHRLAPAPILAPFSYVQLLPMILLGYLVFGDFPDFWTLIGAGVVLSSGLYLLYRERKMKPGLSLEGRREGKGEVRSGRSRWGQVT